MGFTQSITTCFRNYIKFSGRASRSEFWWFALFLLLLHVAATIVNSAIFGPTLTQKVQYTVDSSGAASQRVLDQATYGGGIFAGAVFIVTILPWLSTTWRRMHDIGRRGYWALMPWVLMAVFFGMMTLTSVEQTVDWGSNAPEGMVLPDTISVPQSLALVIIPMLLAFVSMIVVLWWLRTPSQPGPNQYGPNPNEVPS